MIIPVFNRAGPLAEALRSVAQQTFPYWEVVVVDDCSTDDSAQVALRAGPPGKVRLVRHEKNQGPAAARNTGIRESRGRYVSFLDSDDTWHPEKLSRQIELLESDPNTNMVLCATQTRVVLEGGRERVRPERQPFAGEDWSEYLYFADGFAQTNSFLLTRDLATRILFRPNVRMHEDNLFFLDAGALGVRYRLIKEPLSIWNHDDRTDRQSSMDYLARSRRFLSEARGLLTEKAYLAFQVRYIGPLLFRENPAGAIKLFIRAVANGAVRPHHLVNLAVRCIMPDRCVGMLRRLLRI